MHKPMNEKALNDYTLMFFYSSAFGGILTLKMGEKSAKYIKITHSHLSIYIQKPQSSLYIQTNTHMYKVMHMKVMCR